MRRGGGGGHVARTNRMSVALALLMVAGCDAGLVEVFVDVRTDFVPGAEFSAVRTSLGRIGEVPDTTDRLAVRADDFVAGARAAEFRRVARGSYEVRVSLLDADGVVVIERLVLVDVRSSVVTTILLTRDCVGVECPGAGDDAGLTECLGARCVEPGCTFAEPSCGAPACTENADCSATATCARPVCVLGACFEVAEHERCAPTEFCDPGIGCVLDDVLPADAGPGGVDGGDVDGGVSTCPGVCAPGEMGMEEGPCGNCGTQTRTRTCGADCGWEPWGGWSACSGEGECSAGAVGTDSRGCACGPDETRSRTCSSACTWGAYGGWSGCGGSCSPGATRTGSCATCTQQRCESDCGWGGCEPSGACGSATECVCCDAGGSPGWQCCNMGTCDYYPCTTVGACGAGCC